MPTETEYAALLPYCKGFGANICCKNRPIGDSIGVDADPNARAATIIADARYLPFRTGSLDYIVAMHGLEHVREAPLYVIHEWLRCVKVGGIVAVVVPDGMFGELVLNFESLRGEVVPAGHGHLFTLDTLKALMYAAGGDILEARSICRIPDFVTETLIVACCKTAKHVPGVVPYNKAIAVYRALKDQPNEIPMRRFFRRVKRWWRRR